MEHYNLYKSFYDREINRRKDLDAAISLPLTILTIVVAANSFLLKYVNPINKICYIELEHICTFSIFILLILSAYYLMSSYNNFFKGFGYRNIGYTKDLRKYELDIDMYNNKVGEEKRIDFKAEIIKKICDITDNHIIFNDKRSRELYKAKTCSILSLIVTALNFLVITIKYI